MKNSPIIGDIFFQNTLSIPARVFGGNAAAAAGRGEVRRGEARRGEARREVGDENEGLASVGVESVKNTNNVQKLLLSRYG